MGFASADVDEALRRGPGVMGAWPVDTLTLASATLQRLAWRAKTKLPVIGLLATADEALFRQAAMGTVGFCLKHERVLD